MSLDKLLTPFKIGNTTLNNRLVMAPLTRSRASQPGDVPTELNATYYAQRASAGVIISEATQISRQGQGYAWTPGIYTDAQEAGWKKSSRCRACQRRQDCAADVARGRISNKLLQQDGAAPVAPSAIQAVKSQTFVVFPDGSAGNDPCSPPRALETAELPGIVADYVAAAKRAKKRRFRLY